MQIQARQRYAAFRVSVSLIAKNSAATLPLALTCVRDVAHESIVVDTGSADGTQQVATQLGARVFHYSWSDSFAAARNESLRHATGDWILWLDADEYFDEQNRERSARSSPSCPTTTPPTS